MDFSGYKSTHSGRLERYIGTEKATELSAAMRGWYGPPIALQGVPGAVFITKDGDFIGDFREGWETTFMDRAVILQRRLERAVRVASARNRARLNAGFASLSDLITEATTNAKRQEVLFQKSGVTGVIGGTNSLLTSGTQPAAGANATAAPGGREPTRATTGALVGWANAGGGDTLHFVSANTVCNSTGNTLLIYDRIFDVAKTMNSTATEAVTGVPTRYQSTTAGAADYIGGNFLFVECTTALAATAHNWTTCLYQDQDNAASTLPSLTGNSGNIIARIDHPLNQWFAPLAAGDSGIRNLTQMQCSAAVATGAINFVIGHPIAFFIHPLLNFVTNTDGINTAFNLVRIFDDACLAGLEIIKPATAATTYSGSITLVSG